MPTFLTNATPEENVVAH